jgi:REP element-mobilizing transposase RayT
MIWITDLPQVCCVLTKPMGSKPMGFFRAYCDVMGAWNGWYHVNGNTYGTWLRGDPRGWRARHHREHVDGDYKDPPAPGTFAELHNQSRELMSFAKRAPVRLSSEARELACKVIAQALQHHKLDPVAISVDDHHYHLLARFPDDDVRKWVGIAKSRSSRAISESGMAPPGGVWALRNKVTPINDRAHQIAVARYILKHGAKGAAVWRVDRNARDDACEELGDAPSYPSSL